MQVLTGLDVCIQNEFKQFAGKSVGIVCHQASIARDRKHILDHILLHHHSGRLKLVSCFGPQHGIWGHTQDNMIEWEGYTDPRTGLPFYSLYGEHRKPTAEMLAGIDELIIDVQDVGARYYTFIWTMAHCMEACAELGIPVAILDRPNPIGGEITEGPGHDMAFKSFVGLYSLSVRHGLTIGEIALYLRDQYIPKCEVNVVKMEGWSRRMMFSQTGLSWGMPSPNMPTEDTALVYPGQCLLEGTNLSEGRGTTRPFEFFGAPFIDSWEFCEAVNMLSLPGVYFRPVHYQPTFQKCKGEICGGAFIHVTDRHTFRPVLTTILCLREIRRIYAKKFQWSNPPYEYEKTLLPFDILSGGSTVRDLIDNQASTEQISGFIYDSSFHLTLSMEPYRSYF